MDFTVHIILEIFLLYMVFVLMVLHCVSLHLFLDIYIKFIQLSKHTRR